ncbi:MAG: hypothetical protein KF861_11040 [Planctomycetaceae bacterium]|nr:hypothetical protein [Planctomycetaceae bacterium]
MISTFQVTAEGSTFLKAEGYAPGDTIDGAFLSRLIDLGYAFTGSTGPTAIDDTGFRPANPAPVLELPATSQSLLPQPPTRGRTMPYQANLWLMNDLHRRIVAAAHQFSDYEVLLRPTRRHVFMRNYKLPPDTAVSEFFRPCFAILARTADPDKKPCLVIETEDPGDVMKTLYDEHGVLWVLIEQDQNRFVLKCKHGGTQLRVEETMGSLFKLLCAPLAWFERKVSFPQGSYVHSHSERILREAVKSLSPSYRIGIHHQVPLSYVLGYKDDLTPDEIRLLGTEVDAVITQSYDADPDGAVILPIRLDLHDAHRTNSTVQQKDKAIQLLCSRHEVPLLVVEPNDTDGYEFKCEKLKLPNGQATNLDSQEWAGALAPFLGAAIRYAGRSF